MGNPVAWIILFATGLRIRLLLLVVLTCTPLIILTLHTASQDRRQAKNTWRQRALKLAQTASREEDKLLGSTRQLLLALAESDPVRTENRAARQKLMEHLFASYPRYANLGMVAPNGEVVASAVAVPNGSNESQKGYFVRAVSSRSFSTGDFPARTGEARLALHFGLPVFDSSGSMLAVVFAALDLDWQNRFGSELPPQLPIGATWTQVAKDGTIIAHYPATDSSFHVGEKITDTNLLNAVFAQPRGALESRNSRGSLLFYAFASTRSRLVSAPTAGLLAIPRRVLFAEADRVLTRNLTWLGAAMALALLAGWAGSNIVVLRPVRALVKSSTRVAAGDLTARTGLEPRRDELGQLTQAFDQMAQTLEHREADRERASQKLQVLSRRLVEVQESERRKIARELHDEIGQELTAAEINLQAVMAGPVAPQAEARLRATSETIQRVLEQVQDLSLNLRPSMLDDLGLESALRWYATRQAELSGIDIDFLSDPLERRLDSVIETECFRVAQEALTNVLRHSRAQSAKVELKTSDGHLHLFVSDTGTGFDVAAVRDQAVRGHSLGVLSMEERAALVGGELRLSSTPGQGTEVHAAFPLKWRDEHL